MRSDGHVSLIESPLMRLDALGVKAIAASLVVALAFASGCAVDQDHGHVTGKITLDGEPLVDAQVEFIPTGSGSTAYGRTDEDGNYEMEYSRDSVGASVGENQVRITTGGATVDENERMVKIKERIPARYNLKSELIFNVQPGSNTADYELTSDGVVLDTTADMDEG